MAKRIDLYVVDAGRIARDGGPGGPDQHRAADVLLRHLRGARARPGDRGDQGVDPQDLRPPGSGGGQAQPVGGRQRARGPAPRGAPGAGHIGSCDGADRSRNRAAVRPHGDRRDDGRSWRRAAGQRTAGRRHLSQRDDQVREAQHLRPGRGVGRGAVHPVRQLQLRLPAQRDPLSLLRPRRACRTPPTPSSRRR